MKAFENGSEKAQKRQKATEAFDELRRIAAENGFTEMTLDEINAEIKEVRDARRG